MARTNSSLLVVAKSFEAELNGHDLDRVVEQFTDDAVLTFIPTPPPTLPRQAHGKEEIRQIADRLIPGFQIDSRDYALGDRAVTLDARVSTDTLRSIGIDAVDVTAEVAVDGGKISAFTVIFSNDAMERIHASV
jgi:ketosteroid isomerase-like protein